MPVQVLLTPCTQKSSKYFLVILKYWPTKSALSKFEQFSIIWKQFYLHSQNLVLWLLKLNFFTKEKHFVQFSIFWKNVTSPAPLYNSFHRLSLLFNEQSSVLLPTSDILNYTLFRSLSKRKKDKLLRSWRRRRLEIEVYNGWPAKAAWRSPNNQTFSIIDWKLKVENKTGN